MDFGVKFENEALKSLLDHKIDQTIDICADIARKAVPISSSVK